MQLRRELRTALQWTGSRSPERMRGARRSVSLHWHGSTGRARMGIKPRRTTWYGLAANDRTGADCQHKERKGLERTGSIGYRTIGDARMGMTTPGWSTTLGGAPKFALSPPLVGFLKRQQRNRPAALATARNRLANSGSDRQQSTGSRRDGLGKTGKG